jgi:hypothetical protein
MGFTLQSVPLKSSISFLSNSITLVMVHASIAGRIRAETFDTLWFQ